MLYWVVYTYFFGRLGKLQYGVVRLGEVAVLCPDRFALLNILDKKDHFRHYFHIVRIISRTFEHLCPGKDAKQSHHIEQYQQDHGRAHKADEKDKGPGGEISCFE